MTSSTLSDASLIEALTSKKTSIKSQITDLKAQIIQLSGGLSHIDATIALLNGNKIAPAKREVRRNFKPNECKTAVLDLLRTSSDPLDTKTISRRMADQAENEIGEEDFRLFQKSIAGTLRSLEAKGLIKTAGKDGLLLLWAIA